MPHLSPMNWLIVPAIMAFVLLALTSILWWQFIPCFPTRPVAPYSAPKMWTW
uniref:ATP synthase F0 subunit 8 n=1 Tax=Cheilonereis cyclurus TaxID=868083 RepID=A0A345WJZ7_9ANNE|nr:ATP synthase F0 subunit 8 [Cheilonereis cyclurus]